MEDSSLSLHACSEDVERVDNGCTQGSTDRTDNSGCEVVEWYVIFMAMVRAGLSCKNRTFEVLECSEVDGSVGEHADKTKGQAAEESKKTMFGPHFLGCRRY